MLDGLLDQNHIQPVSPSCLYSCMCGTYVKITDDAKKLMKARKTYVKSRGQSLEMDAFDY